MLAWVDGVKSDSVSVYSRGLAYGDGLFETVFVDNNRPQLLGLHLQRLQKGCDRLAIFCDFLVLQDEINSVVSEYLSIHDGSFVLKIIVCREWSKRGYPFGDDATSTRIVTAEAHHGVSSRALRPSKSS